MEINISQLVKELLDTYGIGMHIFQHLVEEIDRLDEGFRRKLFETNDYTDILLWLEEECQENTLYFLEDAFQVHYIIFQMPEKINKTKKCYVSIGPFLSGCSSRSLAADVVQKNQMPLFCIAVLEKYYGKTPVLTDPDILESMVIVFSKYLWGGSNQFKIERLEMKEPRLISGGPYLLEAENVISMSTMEERYIKEDEMLTAIREGDLNRVSLLNFKKYHFEPRTSDRLRDQKNTLVILNTLCRKAVQQAEVHPVHIDRLSAQFAERIENGTNREELIKISRDMHRKYCMLVRNHSLRDYSRNIQKVINYIEIHIGEHLSLKLLAEVAMINTSYLSAQFKKETGQTITEYINHKRIQKSLVYLSATDLPIQNVAEKVGIYDENYFSRLFRRVQNKTPSEYRNMVNARQ